LLHAVCAACRAARATVLLSRQLWGRRCASRPRSRRRRVAGRAPPAAAAAAAAAAVAATTAAAAAAAAFAAVAAAALYVVPRGALLLATRRASPLRAPSVPARSTTNNRSVRLIKGELVAIAYPTSSKPFGKSMVPTTNYGNINSILNPANKDRHSTYSEHFNPTTRTAQSAGGAGKLPVPYSMNAARSRLKDEPPPKTYRGSLNFEMGVLNKSTHPYRTIKDAMEAPNVKPLESMVGFTNQFIVSQMAKRVHKTVWAL